jgi:diaminopimelate epimerase
MMEYRFEKMHGAGNDFIVMDARSESFHISAVRNHIPELCKRRTGIGADGVLMLAPSSYADFTMIYYNADGSEAGMCGNGARCLAKFAFENGFQRNMNFKVGDKTYRAQVHDRYVTVYFPVNPRPKKITAENTEWLEINTGTEHVVAFDDEFKTTTDEHFRTVGRRIRNITDLFPNGTNVNFAYIINENRVNLVTYERGVEDLTLACGTGAIATAIALDSIKHNGKKQAASHDTEQHIQVDCPGGPLEVTFVVRSIRNEREYHDIALHGPVTSVFKGVFQI